MLFFDGFQCADACGQRDQLGGHDDWISTLPVGFGQPNSQVTLRFIEDSCFEETPTPARFGIIEAHVFCIERRRVECATDKFHKLAEARAAWLSKRFEDFCVSVRTATVFRRTCAPAVHTGRAP